MTDLSVTLQILEKVHAFYSNSFNQLIAVVAGGFAVVGVVVPLIVSLIQARHLRQDHAALTATIKQEIADARATIREELAGDVDAVRKEAAKQLDALRDSLTEQVDKALDEANGAIYLLQSKLQEDRGWAGQALVSAMTSARKYINAGDENNLQASLNSVIRLLGKIDETAFKGPLLEVPKAFTALMEALETVNQTGRYVRPMADMQVALDSARQRKQPPKDT